MLTTVDDLLNVLNMYKELYPEFGKYAICIDAADNDAKLPDLKSIEVHIDSDIGQVELSPDIDWD
jgi:hypothetical protein